MYSTPTLAKRFARNTRVLRTDSPLSEDQMSAILKAGQCQPRRWKSR